ncbi:hypothetical protein NQ314_013386, partial [Rhamnusium bicolor]
FCFSEPRCGPMTGAGGEPLPMQSTISPAMTESDLPQPLVVRTPSVSLMKWPSTPSPTKNTTPSRQVSFNYGNDGNNGETARTLSGLDRDCFIIPVHSLDRFLPAGVPMPVETSSDWKFPRKEISRKFACHGESPLVQPLFKQRVTAGELVNEVAQAKSAVTGMLLANMERCGE